MPVLRWIKKNKGYSNLLEKHAQKTTSSNGEDGIIAHIMSVLGIKTGFCVEFGAWDGLVGSNTWRLLNEDKWNGLLIEADPEKFVQLEERYRENSRVTTIQTLVDWKGRNSLDAILSSHNVPANFDLLSIDIDGNDYHVWANLHSFRPRVLVIEFNNHIPNDIEYVKDPDFAINQGCSLYALIQLSQHKGYELVATCGCNAFFVGRDEYPKLALADNSIEGMFDDTRTETRVFQLYDGSLALAGKQRLNWLKQDFTQEDIQILPPEQRFYGKRLQHTPRVVNTSDFNTVLQQGEAAFNNGNIAEAEGLFKQLTTQFPDRHESWNNLGVLNFSRNNFKEAQKCLSTGFAINSTDPDIVYNYMLVLMQLNKYTEAMLTGHQFIAAGGDEARVRPLLDKLPKNTRSALNISVVSTDRLQTTMGFSEDPAPPAVNSQTPLDRWKMEINDAPIFRYLYRNFRPKRHLEFGTWQGAGVVYCLEECDATVWTLNMPFGEDKSNGGAAYSGAGESYGLGATLAKEWAQRLGLPPQDAYRTDSFGFIGRFYLEKQLGNRVCQIYCNSTQWDIANYPEGFFDSVLIDGGHEAHVVLSDTRKALSLLRPGGLIMWHDFCPPVRDKFEVVQGVMSGIEQASELLSASLEKLFWVKPSWILVGIKKS